MTPNDQSFWPKHVALLIPAYKAASELAPFLPRLLDRVPRESILVVDDASFDDTRLICQKLGIDCESHPINRGKGAALRTGFAKLSARGFGWIITMDADGQHHPDDLASFLSAIERHPTAGIIIGDRAKRLGTMPPARIFSNRTTSWILSRYCGQTIRDAQCGYRAYNADLLAQITIDYDRFEMESEIILKSCAANMAVQFVPVQTVYSKEIGSHIRHVQDTLRWINAVVTVSAAISKKKKHRA